MEQQVQTSDQDGQRVTWAVQPTQTVKDEINQTGRKRLAVFAAGVLVGAAALGLAGWIISGRPAGEEKTERLSSVQEPEASGSAAADNLGGKLPAGEFTPRGLTQVQPRVLSISTQEAVKTYDPDTGQGKDLGIMTACCGGSLYFGESGPRLSADRKWVAYVNKKDNNLWLIDVDGQKRLQVSGEGKAETADTWGTWMWISAWSDDGRWLVYYIGGQARGPAREEKKEPEVIGGFYVADLETGKRYLAPELKNVVGFLPGGYRLVLVANRDLLYPKLVTVDVVSGRMEEFTAGSLVGEFTSQFNFAPDGRHLAYISADSDSTGRTRGASSLIYTTFDLSERREVARGDFARVQWPLISPDGRRLVYQRSQDAKCKSGGGGCPQAYLMLYDFGNGQVKELAPIKNALYWFDNSRVAVLGEKFEAPWKLMVINVDTEETKILAEGETLRSQ